MKIRVKLYASLGGYMPATVKGNEMDLELAEGANVTEVLQSLKVPEEMCHLVLVNGRYVPPSDRPGHLLEEGDSLAAWPPVAGGCR